MVSKVTYKLDLKKFGIKDVEAKFRDRAKRDVADYLKEEILQKVGGMESPVEGHGVFKMLSPDYAAEKSGFANPIPNLELTGKMLDALDYQIKGNFLEIGIFDKTQAQKADNHCKFSSKSQRTKVPMRRFIPKGREKFDTDILDEIKGIIDDYTGDDSVERELLR